MINQSQIIELEKRFWQAMREDDIETAVSLTRFPCLIAGPQGSQLVTEDAFRSMMKAHSGKEFEGAEFKNNLVEILNDETAVITYQAIKDGKANLDVSTWVNQNGNWVCAFHSENPIVQ